MGVRNTQTEPHTAFISAHTKFQSSFRVLSDARLSTSNAEALCQTNTNNILSANKANATDAEVAIEEAPNGRAPAQQDTAAKCLRHMYNAYLN